MFLQSFMMIHMRKKPTIRPKRGAITMKARMRKMSVPTNASLPYTNHTEPMMPPIRACEVEIGMPFHVQSASHINAPSKAEKTTYGVMYVSCAMPVPIVSATLNFNRKNAIISHNTAHSTAFFGESTCVTITVEMEFAESFIPLRKVIRSARMNDVVTMIVSILRILYYYCPESV